MSVRPRLVEEGIPIYEQNDNELRVIGRDFAAAPSNGGSGLSSSSLKPTTVREGTKKTVQTRIVIGNKFESADDNNNDNNNNNNNKSTSAISNTDNDCPMMMMEEETPFSVSRQKEERFGTGRQSKDRTVDWNNCRRKKGSVATRIVIGEEAPISRALSDYRYLLTAPSIPSSRSAAITASSATRPLPKEEGTDRMELDDILPKVPLIVLDGANIAYAYAQATGGSSSLVGAELEPDAHGILVAAQYFLKGNCRVQMVIPAPWMRVKPRPGDTSSGNAMMMTPQMDILNDLQARNMLCTSPPADDDDAYSITIARREDARAQRRAGGDNSNEGGGGFVVSNDFFRDAIARDKRSNRDDGLRKWLELGHGGGPGRISYSFCDVDSRNMYGDKELDFIPNPRHLLVERIERGHWAEELSHVIR